MTNPALAVPTLAAQRRQVLRNDEIAVRSTLNSEQTDLEIGQAVPIVFGKRVDGAGGVWLSPPATECRFENDTANRVTASYHLVLNDGQLGTIAVGDVYQGDTPLESGDFLQAYNARAGSWTPENIIQQRFEVSANVQVVEITDGPIGDNIRLSIGDLSSSEIQQLVNENKASYQYQSSGNYITYIGIEVAKEVQWPTVGGQILTRQTGSTNLDNPFREWFFDSFAGYGLPPINPSQAPQVAEWTSPPFGQDRFTVGNLWIYDRTNEARFFPIEQYQVNRTASVEPYGDLNITFQEVIRPGFVLKETLPGISLFGGLAGVKYTLTITEINSTPLPKPEATLYCGTGGTYAGLSTLSVTKQYAADNDGWKRQVHVFARQGKAVTRLIEGTSGASNQYPDLARHLMKQSARVPDDLIDDARLLSAAQFCAAQGFYCDGLVAQATNVREWLDRTAPLFLLTPTNRWGKMGLRPAVPTTGSAINTGAITPALVFDESNVMPGTLSVQYVPRSERVPLAALVLWRDQPENNIGTMRSTEVRYAGQAIDGPYQDIDGSEFITRENHAMRVGALWLARRRHITHSIAFQALPIAAVAALLPGAVIRVNRARNPTVGATSTWSYLYEVDAISGPPLGPWTINATHFPVDIDGRSVVARDLAAASLA